MGTRGVTHVIAEKQTRIAKYCQWDNYPSGRGAELVKVLRKNLRPTTKKSFEDRLNFIKEKVKSVVYVSNEDYAQRWKDAGADDSGRASMEVSNKFAEKNGHLSRNMGGEELLELIIQGKTNETMLDIEFAADSLFCEWAYVVDLDKKVLEVYQGFNTKPLSKRERFYSLQGKEEPGSGYYPVKLVKKYELNNLPTVKTFVEEINKLTQEEEEA